MAKPYYKLQQYWQEWRAGLKTIAAKRGCRVALPDLVTQPSDKYGAGGLRVTLSHPICLLNAPPKGSSHVSPSSSKNVTIFIDGSLYISGEQPAELLHSACTVSFFRQEPAEANAFHGLLVDTAHFDMEESQKMSPFHPVLHAQRGFRDDNLERCKDAIVSAYGAIARDKIILNCADASEIVRNPYLRLPTPQLDIFSVSAIIAADYFCSAGHSAGDPGVKSRFQDLLKLLAGDKNITRDGGMAKRLFKKFHVAGDACVAHWYEEHVVAAP